jgi:hypothetical protein
MIDVPVLLIEFRIGSLADFSLSAREVRFPLKANILEYLAGAVGVFLVGNVDADGRIPGATA